MQESKILILIDDKDRTKEIENYSIVDNAVKIIYSNSPNPYPYNKTRVKIYQNPSEIELKEYSVYLNKKPLLGLTKVLVFDNIVKTFSKNKKTIIYLKNELEIIKKDEQSENTDILEYFKDISQYLKDKESGSKYDKTFLEMQYNKIDNISNESVLYYYLNSKELENREIDLSNLIFPFKFNNSQKDAIKSVLTKNISIIEGPPGTGKTQTILNLLANLIMQNKTIAVVSNNNEAINNVHEKMKNYAFLIANLGRGEKTEEFFKNLPIIEIDSFKPKENIQALLEENKFLNKKLEYLLNLVKEKAITEKKINDFILEQKYFENYINNLNVPNMDFAIELDEEKILEIIFNFQSVVNNKVFFKLFHDLYYSFKYKLQKLSRNRLNYILNLQRKYYELKIKHLKETLELLDSELKDAKFDNIQTEQNKISNEIFQHHLYEKYKNKKRAFTNENYLEQFSSFIDSFPIILSTTYSIRKNIPKDFLFDYVIIDESSQVDLVSGSLALSIAKNAIIVGDEKQLPQIVDLTIKENLINPLVKEQYDYFSNNILSSIGKTFNISKEMLREHYRCHPKIIEFCNIRYYNGRLISYSSEEHKMIEKPLILYYTAPGNHMRKVTNGISKGTYNERELDVIKDEVLKNVNLKGYNNKDIGITSPYRLQADLMSKKIDKIASNTIHKYQGREKKVMIFSTVLDSSYQGKKSLGFVDDAHMLNVAVSRAINQFVLVTHNKMFLENGVEINALLKYIQYQTMDSEIIESNLVSVFDLLYKDYSVTLNKLNKRLLNRSKFKSENIIDTILSTEFVKDKYKDFYYARQVLLKNQFKDLGVFNTKEKRFINNSSSFDFVIYEKSNNKVVLIIEVDGFSFHENNIIQIRRDKIKNSICDKVNIPLIRLRTNATYSEKDIINLINEILFKENNL